MAVIEVQRIGNGRDCELNNNLDGPLTIAFRVRTNDAHDGPFVVLQGFDPVTNLTIPPTWADYTDLTATPISPAEASAFASLVGNAKCKCVKQTLRQPNPEDANLWEVYCTYMVSYPIALPMEVYWDGERVKIGLQSDLDGHAIRNSAGDPFSNPPEVDGSIHQLVVVKNYDDYDPLFFAQFMGQTLPPSPPPPPPPPPGPPPPPPSGPTFGVDTGAQTGGPINDAIFWDYYPEGTMRLVNIRNEYIHTIETVYPFHRRTFTFLIDLGGWILRPLDCGFRSKPPAGSTATGLQLIRDPSSGNPVSAPALLDGTGHDLVAVSGSGAPPIFLDFNVYPKKSFDDLNIPKPW